MVFLARMSNLSSKANYFFCLKVNRFITDDLGYSISNICIRAAKIFQNYTGRLDALLCSSTLPELRTCGICIGLSIL